MDLTQSAFAALAGTSKVSQVRYEKGERSPDGNYLSALAAHGVDVTYILTGQRIPDDLRSIMTAGIDNATRDQFMDALTGRSAERALIDELKRKLRGEDIASRQHVDAILSGRSAISEQEFAPAGYARIRLMALDVSAGTGLGPAQEGIGDAVLLPGQWLQDRRLPPADCALVRVRGDSMAPGIPDGGYILVNTREADAPAVGVYAFTVDGEALVKRLTVAATGPDGRPSAILAVSDNPAYPPRTIAGDQLATFRIAGRVRGVFAFL